MSTSSGAPVIYELNTAAWLHDVGRRVGKRVKLGDVPAEEWDRVLQVNLSGAFYMTHAALPHMVERGYGRIINISSIIGERGNFGQANYAAAKSGMFGLTMSLALETAHKGITVNSVAPGFISTDMVTGMPADVLDRVVSQIPVGRLGEPDEDLIPDLADVSSGRWPRRASIAST